MPFCCNAFYFLWFSFSISSAATAVAAVPLCICLHAHTSEPLAFALDIAELFIVMFSYFCQLCIDFWFIFFNGISLSKKWKVRQFLSHQFGVQLLNNFYLRVSSFRWHCALLAFVRLFFSLPASSRSSCCKCNDKNSKNENKIWFKSPLFCSRLIHFVSNCIFHLILDRALFPLNHSLPCAPLNAGLKLIVFYVFVGICFTFAANEGSCMRFRNDSFLQFVYNEDRKKEPDARSKMLEWEMHKLLINFITNSLLLSCIFSYGSLMSCSSIQMNLINESILATTIHTKTHTNRLKLRI